MSLYEVRLPKMGESVLEATLNNWLVQPGEKVEMDDGIVEVSTDKVDTEIPSEVSGVLIEQKFAEGEVVKVGEVMAVIQVDDGAPDVLSSTEDNTGVETDSPIAEESIPGLPVEDQKLQQTKGKQSTTDRFYSPLVKNIARKEGISQEELDRIPGTGKNGRLTKDDLLDFLKNRGQSTPATAPKQESKPKKQTIVPAGNDRVIPLDRMAKIIASHMIDSVHTSAHVQSFIEIDVTRIVQWRKRIKDDFLMRTGEKITYTPVFMNAIAKVIREYPMVNIQFDGENIIVKNDINLGMAVALPDGNLIVPVIKNADHLSIMGMVKEVNRLAKAARDNKLNPDDISGGTYTVTNVGSFGSITGTPIINQPQVAILALGAIRKVPAVIETPEGDVIGIRHRMIVAHSYDHRVINGALGGQFILRLKEVLENFDDSQEI